LRNASSSFCICFSNFFCSFSSFRSALILLQGCPGLTVHSSKLRVFELVVFAFSPGENAESSPDLHPPTTSAADAIIAITTARKYLVRFFTTTLYSQFHPCLPILFDAPLTLCHVVPPMSNTGFGDQIQIPMPRINKRVIIWGLVAILIITVVRTSIYTVETEEQGVVLRFGQYRQTVNPGLRFKLPFGIDSVHLVPVKRQLKQEFGFATPGATHQSQASSERLEQEQEKSMVTGDLNSALVEWVIQFRIEDPKAYLFNVRNPDDTLRDASESIMREVVGDRTVDEVITVGRQEIEDDARTKLRDLAVAYSMGINIDQVQLKDVNPPQPVQASFNEVNQAQQEREQRINEASAEYNREVPRAEGQADQTISAAEGYAMQRINEAEGDASRFNSVFDEYLKAPEVTKRRLYLETIGEVMPRLGNKVIIDADSSNLLPLLNLNGSQTPAK
jgi:membrane protease subunit HflK